MLSTGNLLYANLTGSGEYAPNFFFNVATRTERTEEEVEKTKMVGVYRSGWGE